MMFAVNLDCSSGTPLFKQLYEQIRESILAGRLRTGARLPHERSRGISEYLVRQCSMPSTSFALKATCAEKSAPARAWCR
jgi:hypothetical protein